MNIQEVNKLLALMKANYSYAFKNMSQQEKYLLLNTWTFTLQDLEADIVMIAVMRLISVCKWMPTVAEIREECQRLHYTAAYNNDSVIEYAINEGSLGRAKDIAYLRKLRSQRYIAQATNHLRGEQPAKLSLDNILMNPAFHPLGQGKSNFETLDTAPAGFTSIGEEAGDDS